MRFCTRVRLATHDLLRPKPEPRTRRSGSPRRQPLPLYGLKILDAVRLAAARGPMTRT